VTFKAVPHLDKKHTVFGKLVGGEDILDALENLPRKDGTERPAKTVRITQIVIYQDPFEEYKTRLAKKLARRAEAEQSGQVDANVTSEKKDDVNWFGVKVGSSKPTLTSESGGVGKYLDLKRSIDTIETAQTEDIKKKRKIGFGNFEGW